MFAHRQIILDPLDTPDFSFNGDAEITFEPGIYVIKGDKFSTSGKVILKGEGVMFYLDGDKATLDWSGTESVNLSAPIDGDYAGVLVFADPAPGKSTKHNMTGKTDLVYEGTIYLPDGDLEVTGQGDLTNVSPYTMLIAREIKIGGNGKVVFNSDYAASDVPLPEGMGSGGYRLVQ